MIEFISQDCIFFSFFHLNLAKYCKILYDSNGFEYCSNLIQKFSLNDDLNHLKEQDYVLNHLCDICVFLTLNGINFCIFKYLQDDNVDKIYENKDQMQIIKSFLDFENFSVASSGALILGNICRSGILFLFNLIFISSKK